MTIFEKIVHNEIPSYKVYEDELVLAFLDITQASVGHTLVITKKPYVNILEIPEDELKHLIVITKKVASAINDAFKPTGINLLNNNGASAGQTVFHFHMHILPKYNHDSIESLFKNKENISNEEYLVRAKEIRKYLKK